MSGLGLSLACDVGVAREAVETVAVGFPLAVLLLVDFAVFILSKALNPRMARMDELNLAAALMVGSGVFMLLWAAALPSTAKETLPGIHPELSSCLNLSSIQSAIHTTVHQLQPILAAAGTALALLGVVTLFRILRVG